MNLKDFRPAKVHALVRVGEVIRILRQKKGWTQEKLAQESKISASNISLLENNRVEIGKKRAEQLAKALDVHPAIIMFPEYDLAKIAHAA